MEHGRPDKGVGPLPSAASFGSGSSLTALRLSCSLRLLYGYKEFRDRLERYLLPPDESKLPLPDHPRIGPLLEVLRVEREREEAKESERRMEKAEVSQGQKGAAKRKWEAISTSATDQDHDMGDDTSQPQARVEKAEIRPSAMDQDDNIGGGAVQLQAPVDKMDKVFEILVRNATEEFGFAPRDVYNGVFHLTVTKHEHTEAKFNYSALKALAEACSDTGDLHKFSHRVVAVYPRHVSFDYDDWVIDFKSVRIAREVVKSMQSEEQKTLWEGYRFLRRNPESTGLAGSYFEGFIHHVFSGGWSGGPSPKPIPMFLANHDPAIFTTDPSSRASTIPITLPSPPPLPINAGTRAVVWIDLARDELSEVTLEADRYYMSTAATNPLFDSFAINQVDQHTIVISIFQAAISERHTGSTEGYVHIRKIMRRVRELLQEGSRVTIKVAYLLVCPEDKSHYQWVMPAGWDDSTVLNDHRGWAYCVRIPDTTHHGISCPSTPNFRNLTES